MNRQIRWCNNNFTICDAKVDHRDTIIFAGFFVRQRDGKGHFDKKDVLTPEQEQAVAAASYAYHTLAKETEV